MGPCVASADDMDIESIGIRTVVSGETMQDSSTANLIFSIVDLIVYCSAGVTLEAGNVIATGTPGGVGDSRVPPRYLREGDVVEITSTASARCETRSRSSADAPRAREPEKHVRRRPCGHPCPGPPALRGPPETVDSRGYPHSVTVCLRPSFSAVHGLSFGAEGFRKSTVSRATILCQHGMDRTRQDGYAETVGRRPPTHVDDAGALGARLRRLRTEKGLSLARLAFDGCSTSYLSRVEAGDRVPSLPILAELARRLDVSVEELAGRDAAGSSPRPPSCSPRCQPAWESPMLVRGSTSSRQRRAGRGTGTHSAAPSRRAASSLSSAATTSAPIAALEQARTRDPGATPRLRPTMFEALGRAYAGVGDLSRGIAVLRTALDDVMRPPADVPGAVRFGVYLASAYTDQGRFAEAEVVLADLIELEPRIADPTARARLQWTLARTYAEQGRLKLAERYGREVLSHLEESEQSALRGRAHLLLGQILLDQRRRTEADEELTRAEELMRDAGAGAPELAMLNAERGRSALLAGDIPGAQAAARKALAETEATEPAIAGSACLVLARAALAEADVDEARFLCRRAIDLLEGTAAPHYRAEAHQVLAVVEERAGNHAAALAALWEGLGAVDRGLL